MEYLFGIKYVNVSKQKPLISITNIIITLYNIISFANSLLSGVYTIPVTHLILVYSHGILSAFCTKCFVILSFTAQNNTFPTGMKNAKLLYYIWVFMHCVNAKTHQQIYITYILFIN